MNPTSQSSPQPTQKIDLWMDNWAWSVSEPGGESEVAAGESENPDDSRWTPPGLYRLGRMLVDLRAECEQLRGAVSEMKIRLTLLEGQLKGLQESKADALRPERRNG